MVIHNGGEVFHETTMRSIIEKNLIQDMRHDRILLFMSFVMFSASASQIFIIFSLKSLLMLLTLVEMLVTLYVSVHILRASWENLQKHKEELALMIITEVHDS